MRKLSNRSFGVELEIVGLDKYNARLALECAGLTVTDDGCVITEEWVEPELDENGEEIEEGYYNEHKEACAAWCVKDDGSVSGQYGECEVVSPKLSGEAGLAELAKACRALLDAGATVNSTCGLHVHLDAKDLTEAEILAVFKRYAKHEDKIDLVLHKSRRGQFHSYAASIRDTARMLEPNGRYSSLVRSKDDLASLPRYLKVNLKALRKYGTIEFRHHNGAVKPETVTNWVRFLMTFVDRTRLMVKHADRNLRDDNPWIGLDLDTRKFYQARMHRAMHGGGRMDNYVITWG